MAIKGKSKSRSARAVTRGPKPAYQPVKTPLLARRGFWMVLGGVLGAAALIGIAIGIVLDRQANEREEQQRQLQVALARYGRELEPILGTVGEFQEPAAWTSFTSLEDALGQLETDKGKAETIESAGIAAASNASNAWGALENLNAAEIVRDRGLDPADVNYILNSREKLLHALKLFEQAGELVAVAAVAEGDQRDALIERARGVFDIARAMFDDGFGDYVSAQERAQAFDPTRLSAGLPPTGPTGVT